MGHVPELVAQDVDAVRRLVLSGLVPARDARALGRDRGGDPVGRDVQVALLVEFPAGLPGVIRLPLGSLGGLAVRQEAEEVAVVAAAAAELEQGRPDERVPVEAWPHGRGRLGLLGQRLCRLRMGLVAAGAFGPQ